MFWEKYTYLCDKTGESPNAVAAKCGVKSSGTTTGWKTGSYPRPTVLKKIADYFGVPVSYFKTAGDPEKEWKALQEEEKLLTLADMAGEVPPEKYDEAIKALAPFMEQKKTATNDGLTEYEEQFIRMYRSLPEESRETARKAIEGILLAFQGTGGEYQ